MSLWVLSKSAADGRKQTKEASKDKYFKGLPVKEDGGNKTLGYPKDVETDEELDIEVDDVTNHALEFMEEHMSPEQGASFKKVLQANF